MMAVPVGAPTHKNRSNYERTRYAHHANHVGQHTIPSPFLESFLLGFGEAVVAHTRPVLLRAVVAISREKLFCPHEPERVKVIGGHYVGTAFAAVQSEQRHRGALSARLVGQHAAVLIVRMSRDHQKAGASVELLETLPESCSAAVK